MKVNCEGWIIYISLPHFWSFPRGDTFDGQEKIREIVVKEVTSLYDENRLREIRELEVKRIVLPAEDD